MFMMEGSLACGVCGAALGLVCAAACLELGVPVAKLGSSLLSEPSASSQCRVQLCPGSAGVFRALLPPTAPEPACAGALVF